MNDWLPWNYAGQLQIDDFHGPDLSPEHVAREYAREEWWPDGPEEPGDEFERFLKRFLCEALDIGCDEPESL